MSPDERDHGARAWLTYQKNWWAYEALEKLRQDSPNETFLVVSRLVDLADDDDLLEDIGAGPLEDLLREHGALVIDEIEALATSENRLRQALSHVWISDHESELGRRLLALGCQPVGTAT